MIADTILQDIDWTTVHDELRKLAGNLRKKCTGEITGVTNGTFIFQNIALNEKRKDSICTIFLFLPYHYVLNLMLTFFLTAEMLDEAELGEFDPLLSCYFKCVMEKGGVVKAFFPKSQITIEIESLKF